MELKDIFIVTGPSGAGKGTVLAGLAASYFPQAQRAITTSTRAMRPGESDGKPYHFISQEDFVAGIARGDFIEWEQHYNDNYYGITRDELLHLSEAPSIGLWEVDPRGVANIKKLFPTMPAICITVESLDTLESRLKKRGMSDALIKERHAYTEIFFDNHDLYDHVIINREGKVDDAVKDLAAFITAHLGQTHVASTNQNNPDL